MVETYYTDFVSLYSIRLYTRHKIGLNKQQSNVLQGVVLQVGQRGALPWGKRLVGFYCGALDTGTALPSQ